MIAYFAHSLMKQRQPLERSTRKNLRFQRPRKIMIYRDIWNNIKIFTSIIKIRQPSNKTFSHNRKILIFRQLELSTPQHPALFQHRPHRHLLQRRHVLLSKEYTSYEGTTILAITKKTFF